MEYKIGQAIIFENKLVFITSIEYGEISGLGFGGFWCVIKEEQVTLATQADILNEALDYGWVDDSDFEVTSLLGSGKYFAIFKPSGERREWEFEIDCCPTETTLKEFCEEGLQAHTLITALNLTL